MKLSRRFKSSIVLGSAFLFTWIFKSPFKTTLSYLVTHSDNSSENSCMNIGECLGGRYIITKSIDSVLSSIARYSIDVNSPSSVILNNSLDEKIAATPPPFFDFLKTKTW